MIRKYGLPLAALGMLVFAVFHVVRAQQTPPKLEPPVTPARSPFGKGVAGAGLVEAQTENISVGTNLPGIVWEVHVKVGQKVKPGQPLFRLDARALEREKAIRKAAVDAARAQLDKLKKMPRKEEVPALEARRDEARANLADQEDQHRRARRLWSQKAIGEEEWVRRDQAVKMAKEQLRKADADLDLLRAGAWAPDRKIAEVNVESAQAQLAQTETELDRLTVRALVAGEVLQVNVRPGEYVSTRDGQALIVLGNVDRLHVRVDIDEHDIPRFRADLRARAMLRGDPRQQFPLTFVRVEPFVIPKKSLTGDNTERVDTRVLQVIYSVDTRGHRLYVGQQLDVYIEGTAEKK
jgi:multidrug efflux pump subunit AcrA (membrane-fusion protein)